MKLIKGFYQINWHVTLNRGGTGNRGIVFNEMPGLGGVTTQMSGSIIGEGVVVGGLFKGRMTSRVKRRRDGTEDGIDGSPAHKDAVLTDKSIEGSGGLVGHGHGEVILCARKSHHESERILSKVKLITIEQVKENVRGLRALGRGNSDATLVDGGVGDMRGDVHAGSAGNTTLDVAATRESCQETPILREEEGVSIDLSSQLLDVVGHILPEPLNGVQNAHSINGRVQVGETDTEGTGVAALGGATQSDNSDSEAAHGVNVARRESVNFVNNNARRRTEIVDVGDGLV
jgi:hypothetical protein